jgi:hypothetical protein
VRLYEETTKTMTREFAGGYGAGFDASKTYFKSCSSCLSSICQSSSQWLLRSSFLCVYRSFSDYKVTHGHSNRVFSIKFKNNDPNILISGGWDNTIQVCAAFLDELITPISQYITPFIQICR